MNFYIYENSQFVDLYPISRTRAAFDIFCGTYKFIDRIVNFFPDSEINLFVRKKLIEVTKQKYPNYKINTSKIKKGIWLLGNVFWSKKDLDVIIDGEEGVYKNNEIIVAVKLNTGLSKDLINKGIPFDL